MAGARERFGTQNPSFYRKVGGLQQCATMCYMSRVTTVGIRELRQNLSKYLRRVESGEAFRVTDRGRQVALLGPLPEESELIDRLIASGRATPARLDLARLGLPQERPVVMPISEALREQREED